MRWVLFIVVLIGLYFADARFFHGQLTRETSQFARNVGNEINQEVSDMVRPLRR